MKHTHKNADGGSSELLLRYIFLLKVQKKVIKIRKTKRKKNKKKGEKKWGGNEAKNLYPSMFLPVLLFFSLYCQERHGMDASREKKD